MKGDEQMEDQRPTYEEVLAEKQMDAVTIG
jgi:hypothetical protein